MFSSPIVSGLADHAGLADRLDNSRSRMNGTCRDASNVAAFFLAPVPCETLR